MPPKAPPPPKGKPKVDPSPPPHKAPTGEEGTTSPEFETPLGSAGNTGTSTPRTVPLAKYNDLVSRFNQLNETIAKLRDRKEFYKGETVGQQKPDNGLCCKQAWPGQGLGSRAKVYKVSK